MKKLVIVLAITLIIALTCYITISIGIPEYRGLQLKLSRNIASFVTWQGLISLFITVYVIAIVKEFIYHKLWLNYSNGLWVAIKTTLLLLTAPILSISLIYQYNKEN